MFNRVTIDEITQHDTTGVYSLYLLEPAEGAGELARQRAIQDRVYAAVDAVIDGQIASDYPASRGKHVRVIVAFKGAQVPPEAVSLLQRLNAFIAEHPD